MKYNSKQSHYHCECPLQSLSHLENTCDVGKHRQMHVINVPYCVFLLENSCRVSLRCFHVERPVETQPGVKFSECHTATQHSTKTIEVVLAKCLRVMPNKNTSDCWLVGGLVLTCTEVWPKTDLALLNKQAQSTLDESPLWVTLTFETRRCWQSRSPVHGN